MFSVFKQHYTHFHTFFHSHVILEKTKNCCLNTRTKQTLNISYTQIWISSFLSYSCYHVTKAYNSFTIFSNYPIISHMGMWEMID